MELQLQPPDDFPKSGCRGQIDIWIRCYREASGILGASFLHRRNEYYGRN